MTLKLTPELSIKFIKLFLFGFVFCFTGLIFAILVNSLTGVILFLSLMGVVLVLSIILTKLIDRKAESESQNNLKVEDK